uniref:ATP synthase F0 subunit 8 n=1 Tax=Cardiocondyla obscurior TaxID=286306 RepID=A0A2U8XC71_9HYME|nr:ATP synthase F0 subunit 8 [Cardiocondyla obscurior]
MPQMMPLFWLMMILSTITLLVIFSTYLYFLYLPTLFFNKSKISSLHYWNWKW